MNSAEENLYLLQIAQSRLSEGWQERTISHEDFWKDAGITKDEIENTPTPEIE